MGETPELQEIRASMANRIFCRVQAAILLLGALARPVTAQNPEKAQSVESDPARHIAVSLVEKDYRLSYRQIY